LESHLVIELEKDSVGYPPLKSGNEIEFVWRARFSAFDCQEQARRGG
jgi:hypothetical protein